MLNIALVSTAFTDYFPASDGLTAYDHIGHMQKYNCFFHVIASNVMIKKPLANFKHYGYAAPSDYICARNGAISAIKRSLYASRSFSKLTKVLRKVRISLIHQMNPATAGSSFSLFLLLRDNRKDYPFILGPVTAMTNSFPENDIVQKTCLELHLRTVKNASAITVMTPSLKEVYSRIVGPDRVWVMPTGVNTNYFFPRRANDREDDFEVLTVTNLIERKGIEYLIRAIAILLENHVKLKLKIVGQGPEKPRLEQITKNLKLEKNVFFEDYVPNPKLRHLYQTTDFFCLPSLQETYGKVILEAMACGKPVVVTNTYGPRQIVNHMKDGIVVPPADPQALADALLLLIQDESLRKKIGVEGRRKTVEEYSLTKAAERYYKLYRSLALNS